MRRIGRILLILLALLLLIVLIGPFLVTVRPLDGLAQPRDLAGPDSQFIIIPFTGTDGVDLHYREQGGGPNTFILLHGFNYNLTSWNNVFDFFGTQGRTIAYDRIPFGLSERLVEADWSGPNPYAPEAECAQLIGLMDAMGVEDAVLVGNSAGGQMAVEFTLAHPQRVTALILVDAAIYRGGVPAWANWLLQSPQADRVGPLLLRRFGGNDLFNRIGYVREGQPTPASRAASEITFQVANWDAAMWEFQTATGLPPDLASRLGQIDVPVLVITGDEDAIVPPEESVRAADALPNATLATLSNCGHFPQDECPELFVDAVSQWLADGALSGR